MREKNQSGRASIHSYCEFFLHVGSRSKWFHKYSTERHVLIPCVIFVTDNMKESSSSTRILRTGAKLIFRVLDGVWLEVSLSWLVSVDAASREEEKPSYASNILICIYKCTFPRSPAMSGQITCVWRICATESIDKRSIWYRHLIFCPAFMTNDDDPYDSLSP